jgi:hypothetical protein
LLVSGGGIYSHRELIVPEVRSLLRRFSGYSDYAHEAGGIVIIRTLGFPALLIDTGLIGIALYLWNVALAVERVDRGPLHTLFAGIAILSLLWLFVTNILDMVLLYMLVMPGGLLERWSAAASGVSSRRDSGLSALAPVGATPRGTTR